MPFGISVTAFVVIVVVVALCTALWFSPEIEAQLRTRRKPRHPPIDIDAELRALRLEFKKRNLEAMAAWERRFHGETEPQRMPEVRPEPQPEPSWEAIVADIKKPETPQDYVKSMMPWISLETLRKDGMPAPARLYDLMSGQPSDRYAQESEAWNQYILSLAKIAAPPPMKLKTEEEWANWLMQKDHHA